MRALVLRHIACEPPGAYEDVVHAQKQLSAHVPLGL
jgi:hypothetical protein